MNWNMPLERKRLRNGQITVDCTTVAIGASLEWMIANRNTAIIAVIR